MDETHDYLAEPYRLAREGAGEDEIVAAMDPTYAQAWPEAARDWARQLRQEYGRGVGRYDR